MKTTVFKVHTVYTKEDILKMEKASGRKTRRWSFAVSALVFVLYLAVVIWEALKGEGHVSLFSFIPGGVLDTILLLALICSIAGTLSMPYIQSRRVLKTVPGGVLKANYYFYEKTFQYGWGGSFQTIAYMDVQEFLDYSDAYYFKANDLAYWVKKSDFEVGSAEDFLSFMESKISCKTSKK